TTSWSWRVANTWLAARRPRWHGIPTCARPTSEATCMNDSTVGPAASPLLRVRRLNAWYGQAHILSDLEFQVMPGEVVALVGRNGAGKSTTLKAVMGLLERVAGEIWYCDQPVLGLPPYKIARLGLGYVPEDRRVFSELT